MAQSIEALGYHLSPQQRRLWSALGAGEAFAAQCAVAVRGELDPARLRRAVERLVDRHEILRTAFELQPGIRAPVQVIADRGAISWREIDAGDRVRCRGEVWVRDLLMEERQGFAAAPAAAQARFTLASLAPGDHVLACSLSPLAADAATLHNLVVELGESYAEESAGPAGSTAELVQYVQFAAWQGELAGDESDAGFRYWRTWESPTLGELRLAGESSPRADHAFAVLGSRASVDGAVSRRLAALAADLSLPPEAVLLSCWAVLLSRWSGEPDLVVHRVFDGRTFSELRAGMGLFAKAIPIAAHVPPELSLLEVARALGRGLAQAEAQQESYFWQDRLTSETAAESVGFEYRRWPEPRWVGGVELSLMAEEVCCEPFKVRLVCSETPAGVLCEVQADRRRLGAGECAALVSQYVALLLSASLTPLAAVGELASMGEEERRRLVVEFNGERRPLSGVSVPEQFERQVALGAARPALRCEEELWSYGELNARANRLAHRLRRLGVAPERPVALCLERSPALVAALLAVLKAGGAYLPLEPTLPRARRQLLVRESGASLVLSQRSVVGGGEEWEGVPLLCLDEESAALSAESAENPSVGLLPENLAYVLFTSGSTGTPKGVAVEHRQLSGYVDAIRERLALPSGAVYGLVSTFAADLGNTVLFPSLCCGGELVLVSQERLGDGESLGEYLSRHPVDCLKIVPSHLRALLQSSRASSIVPRRCLVLGGESWRGDLLSRVRELSPWCRVLNHYGPTETTVGVLSQEVAGDLGGEQSPALGRPLAHAQVYLLDGGLRPVPSGPTGEIYVGGSALARGYLGRPELTAERFVPHPWSGEHRGERLYRTGDLGRFTPSGDLLFLGRGDHQVKIRGFRVELGEIEAALRAQAGVRDAAVVAQRAAQDGAADPLLVAYVVPQAAEPAAPAAPSEGASTLSITALRGALAERLPQVMQPAHYMVLKALPLTANGKVNRQLLPPLEPLAADAATGFVPPRTQTEELLAKVWEQVLGCERIGALENFFAAGGHSLRATQVVSRVREIWRVEIPVRQLFLTPTLSGLAESIDQAQTARGGAAAPPIERPERAPEGGDAPLSFSQTRLWFLHHLEPESPAYNTPAALRLQGELEPRALDASLSDMVRRHEILRSVFPAVEGQPVARVTAARALRSPIVDLCGLPAGRRAPAASALARGEARRLFDLAHGPLFRLLRLQLGERDHILLVTTHHIVSDGWSRGIMARELGALYSAHLRGAPSPLPVLPFQYSDFARWQRLWLQGEALEAQLAYWREQLAGAPAALDLPTDRPRPAVQSRNGAAHSFAVPAALVEPLRARLREQGVTLFMLLLAGLQALLRRHSHQTDVNVGVPIAGRNRLDLEPLIGFFVNTLVLRVDLAGDPPFARLLGRVREVALAVHAHQDLPFETLIDELGIERNLSRTPLFQVMLTVQDSLAGSLDLPGLRLTPVEVASGAAKFDLELRMTEGPEGLSGSWLYSTDLFDSTTVARLSEQFVLLLAQGIANPEQRLSGIELLGPAQRWQMVGEWNDTASAEFLAARPTLNSWFEEQVDRSAEAVALVFRDAALSYRELDRRASSLAHRLRDLGVGPEVLVGIAMERSLELLVGLLAILKAGGGYVPIDPSYPAERIAFMLEDSGVPLLLSQKAVLPRLPERLCDGLAGAEVPRVLLLDAEEVSVAQRSSRPARFLLPENSAYMIYTSGSTGRPKGAINTHRAIVNRLLWMQHAYQLEPGDRVLQKTPLSFDVSVWELFWPLLAGARQVLAEPGGHQDPAYLVRLIVEQEITTVHFVPSLLRLFLEQPGAERCTVLTRILSSGEALSADLAGKVDARLPNRLHNLYGPTEAAVDVTFRAYRPMPGREGVPIGRPIANLRIYLVDHLQPVPLGVAGELQIGGVGLARGYLSRPDLTAEKFIPDSFGTDPGERLYRTGDLARQLGDGEVEYLGRLDTQVKIRGQRIEPGEIEAALARHPAVREAVVLAGTSSEGPNLRAYLTVQESFAAPSSAAGWQEFLRGIVPDFMIPATFTLVDSLPLTPNGKLDRAALLATTAGKLEAGSFMAPVGPIETALAEQWAQILGLERVGRHDNFFALGGDSILAIQIIARANREGFALVPRQLFQHPTVAELAAVAQIGGARAAAEVETAGPVPLTPIQHWFFSREIHDPHEFSQTLLLHLGQELSPALVERAVGHLVRHHDSLRLRFAPAEQGGWAQFAALPGSAAPFTLVDLAALPEAARLPAVAGVAAAAQGSLDLASGPLLRTVFFTMGSGLPDRLLITLHHLVVDGVSWRILLEDLETVCRQLAGAEEVALAPKTTSFKRWAERLSDHVRNGGFAEDLEYWATPPIAQPLLPDLPGGRNTVGSSRTVCTQLDAESTATLLSEMPAGLGARVEEILLAVLGRAHERWTGETSLLLHLESHGREDLWPDLDLSRTLGWFTSLMPVSLSWSGACSSAEVLRQVKEQLRRIPGRGIGFGALRYLGESAAQERLRNLPAPTVIFNYLGQLDRALPISPWFGTAEQARRSHSPRALRIHLLEWNVRVLAGRLELVVTYSQNLHRRTTVERLVSSFEEELRSLIAGREAAQGLSYTPSDFPQMELDQEQLDELLSELSSLPDG